ncbi:MAG: hypothetical protein WA755_20110 [Candidatus Acidiferrales bacterium]
MKSRGFILTALLLLSCAPAMAESAKSGKPAAKAAAADSNSVASILGQALDRANGISDMQQKSAALSKLVDVQIQAGDLDVALQTASSIPNSDVRARAFAQVAFARAKAGDSDAAYSVAELATQGEATGLKVALSAHQQQDYRNIVLKAIGAAQAARGNVAAVRLTAAKGTTSSDIANEYLRLIGRAQMKAGDLAGAEKSFVDYLRSMPDSGAATDTGSLALELMASSQLEFDDVAGAQETAARIHNGATQAAVLARIASAQAQTGNRDTAAKTAAQALATAQAYRDLYGYDKSRALLEIVKANIAIGDFSAALGIARTVPDGFTKSQAFAAVAVAEAKAGDLSAALQTANFIVDDAAATNHEDALQEIAVALAEAGNIVGARATAAALPNDYDTSDVAGAVAIALARAGDYKAGLATADTLLDTDRRAWSFRIFAVSGIARAQAEAGDVAGAKAWIATLNSPALEASALMGAAEGLMAKPGRT